MADWTVQPAKIEVQLALTDEIHKGIATQLRALADLLDPPRREEDSK
jgi:DNA mismatch repair ATPase MutL